MRGLRPIRSPFPDRVVPKLHELIHFVTGRGDGRAEDVALLAVTAHAVSDFHGSMLLLAERPLTGTGQGRRGLDQDVRLEERRLSGTQLRLAAVAFFGLFRARLECRLRTDCYHPANSKPISYHTKTW